MIDARLCPFLSYRPCLSPCVFLSRLKNYSSPSATAAEAAGPSYLFISPGLYGKTFESIRWLYSLAFQSVPISRISSERARLSSTLWSPRINQSGERRRCLILQIGGGSRNRASTFSAFENVKRRDKRNRIGVIWSGKRNHPASSSKFSLFLSLNSCARM